MLRHRSLEVALVAALLGLTGTGCRAGEAQQRPELGLMATIPLYWGEERAFGDALSGEGTAHWARAQIENRYRLRPLDTLGEDSLAGLEFLLLAQPRALTGAENVALDAWVRAGGHLLLFADPLLTGESRFPIGDRRRPQDVVLLSPILSHWGLRLEFDEDQLAGFALTAGAPPIPVNLPGKLVADGACAIESGGVLARCAIGEGSVLILADAAVLDLHEPHPAAPAALDWLLDEGFGRGKSREVGFGREPAHVESSIYWAEIADREAIRASVSAKKSTDDGYFP